MKTFLLCLAMTLALCACNKHEFHSFAAIDHGAEGFPVNQPMVIEGLTLDAGITIFASVVGKDIQLDKQFDLQSPIEFKAETYASWEAALKLFATHIGGTLVSKDKQYFIYKK